MMHLKSLWTFYYPTLRPVQTAHRNSTHRHPMSCLAIGIVWICSSFQAACGSDLARNPEEFAERDRFVAAKLLGEAVAPPLEAQLELVSEDSGIRFGSSGHALFRNVNWDEQPLRIGPEVYHSGLYMHAKARVRVRLPTPGSRFLAVAGVDGNHLSLGRGSVVCAVYVGEQRVYQSPVLRSGGKGEEDHAEIDVDLRGAQELILEVQDAGDGIACDFGVWANARVVLENGKTIPLGGELTGGNSAGPPFSFRYGGQSSTELLPSWKVEREVQALDAQRTQQTITYIDPATNLEVRCVAIVYADFPTVEWTVYFTNKGSSDTPILSDVEGLDISIQRGATGEFKLHYQRGSTATPDECEPFEEPLRPGARKQLAPAGGRPTSEFLPYFNIEWYGAGAIAVLGWPGQWSATFQRTAERDLRISGGQELTHLRLMPGESIRTPLCVLQFWQGDTVRAQNIWRRWMIAHNLPRPAGQSLSPKWCAYSGAQLAEMMMANEQNQIEFIDAYLDQGLKIDAWWMDYAWNYYKGNDIRYEVDRERFPRGLRAITDHAHERGVKSIVWFEPEVCTPAYRVYQSHPEWILGEGHSLLNLGIPEARQWATDMVHEQLITEGIDVFRTDYNTEPLRFWRVADTTDRQGITENKYVTGYLEYLDELLRRNPDLLIDSCSSGGRRNDLETMRRAVPLWRSDYNNLGYAVFNYIIAPRKELATSLQNHTYGLARWLPYFGTAARDIDPYVFRSSMCPSILTTWDVRRKDLDYELLRKLTGEWRSVADYYLGDYYPLMEYSQSQTAWLAWQFDRPDLKAGLVQIFRREDSPIKECSFSLRGLEPDRDYHVTDMDTGTAQTFSGQQLLDGELSVAINNRPGARLLTYKRQPEVEPKNEDSR